MGIILTILLSEKHQEENYFLKTQGVVPLKTEFKPAMKVLSRKPVTKPANPVDGIGQLNIDDEEEDEGDNKDVMTPEQQKQKTQREREEKQKAYEERRRELFGRDSQPVNPVVGRRGGSPRNQSRSSRALDSRPSSSASNKNRQLYDPHESPKPDNLRPQRMEPQTSENRPTREPRAPDGSGRGGFGFAPRGGHST